MKIKDLFISLLVKIRRVLIASNHEPKIEQKRDRFGNLYWLVQDARSRKSHTFGSEQDVRAWIENRYHSL
ncbi:MAG: hypothetical protein AAGE96_15435 [Cyanobacteria bacterium P01_G01_bin.19]